MCSKIVLIIFYCLFVLLVLLLFFPNLTRKSIQYYDASVSYRMGSYLNVSFRHGHTMPDNIIIPRFHERSNVQLLRIRRT